VKKKAAVASGSILPPPASLQSKPYLPFAGKRNSLHLNHHSRKGSPRRDKTSRIYEAGRIACFQRLARP